MVQNFVHPKQICRISQNLIQFTSLDLPKKWKLFLFMTNSIPLAVEASEHTNHFHIRHIDDTARTHTIFGKACFSCYCFFGKIFNCINSKQYNTSTLHPCNDMRQCFSLKKPFLLGFCVRVAFYCIIAIAQCVCVCVRERKRNTTLSRGIASRSLSLLFLRQKHTHRLTLLVVFSRVRRGNIQNLTGFLFVSMPFEKKIFCQRNYKHSIA